MIHLFCCKHGQLPQRFQSLLAEVPKLGFLSVLALAKKLQLRQQPLIVSGLEVLGLPLDGPR